MKIELQWTVWGLGVLAGATEHEAGMAIFLGPLMICFGHWE
jgi:hypothetical protein